MKMKRKKCVRKKITILSLAAAFNTILAPMMGDDDEESRDEIMSADKTNVKNLIHELKSMGKHEEEAFFFIFFVVVVRVYSRLSPTSKHHRRSST